MTAGERVLVTGASGFLGRPLVRKLAAAGHEVHGVSRRVPTGDTGATAWWSQDLADAEATAALVARLQPDVIVHLTSESRGAADRDAVRATVRNDLLATINVLDAAAAQGSGAGPGAGSARVRRVILTTTLDEPTGPVERAVPTTPYAAAKWAAAGFARMYAARFGLAVTILRPMMTYGPGQKPFKIVPSLILAGLAGKAAPMGSGTRAVDWVFVDDVVDAFVAAVDAQDLPIGPIDLGSGRLETIASVAEQVGALIPGSVPPAVGSVTDRAGEVVRRARTRPARDLLGWRATTSLGDGLQRTIAAYRLQPMGDDYPEHPSQPAVLPGRLGDAADEAGGHTR